MNHSEKLIRDNIPEIISMSGCIPHIRVLSVCKYENKLESKLMEETNEYLESKNVEELADIIEVIYALAKLKGISLSELEAIRSKKALKNGSYNKRLLFFDITTS